MSTVPPPDEAAPRHPGVVFVDADDTLWENALHFHRVLHEWADLMATHGVARRTALGVLHETEDRNIPRTGYGAAPFTASVVEASASLVPGLEADRGLLAFARHAEVCIRDHPIDLLPGVEEGLAALSAARRVVVLTKGQDAEQRGELERSGLLHHLAGVRVVEEKDVATYREAARAEGAPAAACWMIGNSPRSDVNPARRAGFRTVLVPHAAPWHREMEPLLGDGPATVVVSGFGEVPGAVLGRGRG